VVQLTVPASTAYEGVRERKANMASWDKIGWNSTHPSLSKRARLSRKWVFGITQGRAFASHSKGQDIF